MLRTEANAHTFLPSGGDIHSEQQLPAHMIRGEATTQAVADYLITKHTHLKQLCSQVMEKVFSVKKK